MTKAYGGDVSRAMLIPRAIVPSAAGGLIPSSGLQTFNALGYPNYRLLAVGQATASLGQQMRVLLRGFLIYELTGSPLWLAAITGLIVAPMFVVPLISGAFVDRMDRQKLLVASEALLLALWALVSIMIYGGQLTPLLLLLATIPSGTFQGLERPARLAIIPDAVNREHIPNAIALQSAIQSATVLIGPTVGGLVYTSLGVATAFLVTALLQGITLLTAILLRVEGRAFTARAKKSVAGDILEGMRYIRHDEVLRSLVVLGLIVGVFGTGYVTFLPMFAKDVLHAGANGLALLLSANGAGTLLGALVVATFGSSRRQGLLLTAGGISSALLLLAFASSEVLLLSLGIVLVMGLVNVAYRTTNLTVLQLAAPDHMMGRLMGFSTVMQAFSPISVFVLALLADRIGIAFAMQLSAAVLAVMTVAILASNRKLRQFTYVPSAPVTVNISAPPA